MKHGITLLLCWLSAVALYSARTEARDYFVSAEGDDTRPGTESQPWQTIERVNQLDLEPGDQVFFRGGDVFRGNLRLDVGDSGDEKSKVSITSYGEGLAVIDAGDGDGLVAANCHHFLVKEMKFRGVGRNSGSDGSGIRLLGGSDLEVSRIDASGFRLSGVAVDGASRVRVTHVRAHRNGHAGICTGVSTASHDLYIGHCLAENNPGDPKNTSNHSGNGIVIGRAEDVLVEHCVARNNGWDMPRKGNGPVGIWTWNTRNITIQHCIAYDNKSPGDDGGGFDIDGGTENAVLQYNLSYNNDGPGYFLCQYPTAPPLKNNIIRYNISHNDGRRNNRRAGIDVFSANDNASGCEIYNNTVYNEYGAAVGFAGYPIPGVVFRNNIFVAAKGHLVGDFSHARFEGNLWWSLGDGGFAAGKFDSFQEWVAATGQETVDGEVVGRYEDPRLVRTDKLEVKHTLCLAKMEAFRLLPDSPCLAAGIVVRENGGRDFWGTRVPADRRPTIGAYQEAVSGMDATERISSDTLTNGGSAD